MVKTVNKALKSFQPVKKFHICYQAFRNISSFHTQGKITIQKILTDILRSIK